MVLRSVETTSKCCGGIQLCPLIHSKITALYCWLTIFKLIFFFKQESTICQKAKLYKKNVFDVPLFSSIAERGFLVPKVFWFCVPVEKGFLFQIVNEFVKIYTYFYSN